MRAELTIRPPQFAPPTAHAGRVPHVDVSGVNNVVWLWFSHLSSRSLAELLSAYGDEASDGRNAAKTLKAVKQRADASLDALLALCPERVANYKDGE